jgi:hypothetical protein
MFRCFWILIALLTPVAATPITVVITGNFGAPTGGTTILDDQNYSIVYTIPDPHTPTNSMGIPNTWANAEYQVPTLLSIPGINFSALETVGAGYYDQQPLGLWLNLMTFTGLPVGDFMVMTPLQTLDGSTLWNGLAGALGDPDLTILGHVPASARFFVEQNTTNQGPTPLAVYERGTAFISQTSVVPEPATSGLTGTVLLAIGMVARFSHKR